ncbi:hypothetical protein IDH44_14540 [Paenibacillus sp. IB182496]|uniref:Uncharacterized protein n=1 Tax=Paenibacillus sabuli TaxID=2772509 RepID=A0A927BTC2_9BACL|nr:hypothetical protein [Paenibacillus sabuli]MBD2846416.1 hypothetical protein [Paenibacillus sabuli]
MSTSPPAHPWAQVERIAALADRRDAGYRRLTELQAALELLREHRTLTPEAIDSRAAQLDCALERAIAAAPRPTGSPDHDACL